MKIALCLFFSYICCVAPLRGDAQTPAPLVVNYAAINANMLNLWVGKEGGHFAEEGLDVRILHVRGGSLGVQLLVSGQTPIGLVGATAIANAYLQGSKDLVMIGGVTNVMAYVLASKPEIQSRKPNQRQDLGGQPVRIDG